MVGLCGFLDPTCLSNQLQVKYYMVEDLVVFWGIVFMRIVDWKQQSTANCSYSTTTGNVKVIENFYMPQLKKHRRVWIYLPPDYDMSNRRYPVLYMHDGQNLFDQATSHVGEWHVDKTLDRLFYDNILPGLIVVGIDNGQESRFDEYIPWKKGSHYACFLMHTLKPFIDKQFRTLAGREYTGIMGSSLGGLISLYTGAKYQNIFSKIGAVSPAMYFAGDSFSGVSKRFDMRIYMDVGTRENLPYVSATQYADDVWKVYFQFICAGFTNEEMRLIVEKDADHEEAAWSWRFASTVQWMYC